MVTKERVGALFTVRKRLVNRSSPTAVRHCIVLSMSDTAIERTTANPKAEKWAERIAAQQRSGISVKQFCKEHELTEYSFYAWRKRLREKESVRFALVERRASRQGLPAETVLELVLTTGERLRIGTGVDGVTLRAVLEALRA